MRLTTKKVAKHQLSTLEANDIPYKTLRTSLGGGTWHEINGYHNSRYVPLWTWRLEKGGLA